MDAPVEAGPVVAPRQQRDRVIPLRKSDIIDGLVAEGRLDEADQEKFTQLARMLGAILHYEYSAELDRLSEPYLQLSEEFIRILTDANFVEVSHEDITKAFAERARVRVKIKAPIEDY